MLNQIVIVGRLVSDPEINETENERKVCNITLAVPRSFKNADGEYDTDFIPVTLWEGIAENVRNYCHEKDMVGIRGRLQSKDNKLILVAEKVTFLSSNSEKNNSEINK